MKWSIAEVVGIREETPTARTLMLRIPDWPGALAGQHIDIRLTAPDGYQAARSYSLSSAAGDPVVSVSVELMPDGEVSPYLVRGVSVGDQLEVIGPLGGWFVWRPTAQPEPLRLIGGGSGIAPLMSILRTHAEAASTAPVHLLYSVRSPEFVYYRDELAELAAATAARVDIQYTRRAPEGWAGALGRIDAARVTAWAEGTEGSVGASNYICGPTPFVELASNALVAAGADPTTVRTERFGG
ncbi:FAD-binding oxidoreductase [Herbiconiux sp.]|uniref:FAD-binding oxidoreductase n=1 Tax=Herbiconiux sp. TaxID=1871186 RepID=UPI0025B8B70B|nr:FAD-binding oxidoreductase [Herbiconiux sp.]